LCRRRTDEDISEIVVKEQEGGFIVNISKSWTKKNPLTQFGLEKESADWKKIGRELTIEII
jgi:exopolyphosphatase/guanosine-5'-triphosphate,3'-diphosphate pyrophosphatase